MKRALAGAHVRRCRRRALRLRHRRPDFGDRDRGDAPRARASRSARRRQAWFEYGTTDAARHARPLTRSRLGRRAPVPVSKRVTGLLPEHRSTSTASAAEAGDVLLRPGQDVPDRFERAAAADSRRHVAFSGSDRAHGRALLSRRPGLRRRAERPDQGLRQPGRHARRPIFADLGPKVHAFWDRGLLGLALDPDFPAKPYVYVSYAHDAVIGGHRAALGQPKRHVRLLPDAARPDRGRLRDQRPDLPPYRRWQLDDRARAGPRRGLVPAVPEPLGRLARVRAGRLSVRLRRRRRELQRRRLRPVRRAQEPMRRPAGGSGRRARHRRPRRAARCAARTSGPPATRPA